MHGVLFIQKSLNGIIITKLIVKEKNTMKAMSWTFLTNRFMHLSQDLSFLSDYLR